jgi:hypothetical protein
MKPITVSCAIALSVLLSVLGEASLPQPQVSQAADPVANAPVVAPPSGLQPEGPAFSLSSALDRGRVVHTPEGFLLSGRGYRADVSSDGLRFVPNSLPADRPFAGRQGELLLSLTALASEAGERALTPSGPPTQPGGVFGDAVVTPYGMNGLAQTVHAYPDGVDLGVWLRERPGEAGDLRLVFALDASVEQVLVETVAGEHTELTYPGHGRVLVGRALAIDAAGQRTELTMRASRERLEIELDAPLLDGAAFPLWIDPKIGSALPISGSASTRDVDPDTVFDPVTGQFVVVWERAVSGTESDIWGARVDAAGTLAAGPFPVDVTASTLATRPRIAVDPATGSYLVAYEDQPVGGSKTVRWSLLDATDTLVASNAFTVSGYLADARPDVGFVQGPVGASGFVIASRRDSLSTPDSTVQVTWVDATTGAAVDSQPLSALSPPRDDLPALPQLSDSSESLVAFQRFNTATFIQDVQAACVTLGGGVVSLGTPLAVTADATSADGAPDVSVVNGTFQVIWERLVLATSNRDLRGREVLPSCAGFAGAAFDVSNLALLESAPAVLAGRYSGGCDGQSMALFLTTPAPAGSGPLSVVGRRWNPAAPLLGPTEIVAAGQSGVSSFSTPRAALDSTSTTLPLFLVVYDDDGTGTNAAAEVFGQLVTFDGIPLTATVSPATTTQCAGTSLNLVVTTTGTGPFTYQWRQDGVPIPGATSPSYAISSLSSFSEGTYDVLVNGACGSLLSTPAEVIVDQPITGLAIATSASPVCAGSDVVLTATVTQGIPDTYEWLLDGVLVDTTTVPSLSLPGVTTADAGSWTVKATNVCGTATSGTPAVLQVDEPIVDLAIDVSASPVCEGSDVTLTASTTSGTPTGYGWFRNGTFLQVTTVPTLDLVGVTPGNAGSYTVRASNACGSTTSVDPTVLEVDEPITGVTIGVSASPVCEGSSVTFTADTATGVPRNYGWFRDGVFVAATTVPSLTLNSVSPASAGAYSVRASNACGVANTAVPVDLDVDEPITSVGIAVSASPVCTGSVVTFTATTTGGTPRVYGWFRNGTFVQVTQTPTLDLPAVVAGDSGNYTVQAGNSCGNAASAGSANLQVDEPITGVSIAASSNLVCAGSSVTFTAATATGVPSSYGWFRNGTFVKLTQTPTLVVPGVTPANAGNYTVTASNACGNATSASPASLAVDEPITGVTVQVSASPVCVGTNVTVTASTATGAPSSYGWFRNGVFLTVTSGPVLNLPAVTPDQAGAYTVRVGNACGTASSPTPAVLTVDQPITSVAIGLSGSPVCAGSNVTLSATSTGGSPSSYEWRRDGTAIDTTSLPTLVLANVSAADAGSYTVRVVNSCGQLISQTPATLVVSDPIGGVKLESTAPGACLGDTVTFTATALSGTGPFLYEWRKDGVSLGAPTPDNTLVINSAQGSDSGSYQAIVSNACGAVTSQAVSLSVYTGPNLYCTAKPNSLGCASAWTWSGTPSISAGSGFNLGWGPSPGGGNNFGIFIYSVNGAASSPITNIYGTLCLPPAFILRTPFTTSGGTNGTCSGQFNIDFNAFVAGPSAPPYLEAGMTVDMQCWYRDIVAPGGANFSNAINFVLCQ